MRERAALCPKEASQRLGCSEKTVYRAMRAGRCVTEGGIGQRPVVLVEKSRVTGIWRLVPSRAARATLR